MAAACSAFDKVSFSVGQGEIKLVLGGSGSGKSTIINLILGLLKPDGGQVLVEGEDIKLETAECYLLLKRACSSPQSVASARDANEGIRRLEAILAKEPKASPHTYHVFAVQGLLWIEKAKIRGTERNDLLVRLWRHLEKTAYLFPHNEILEKARSAVLRARALS